MYFWEETAEDVCDNSEKSGVRKMLDYTYDKWKELGYSSMSEAVITESMQCIAIQLAKLNDKLDPLVAYMMGFMEWTRENSKEDN